MVSCIVIYSAYSLMCYAKFLFPKIMIHAIWQVRWCLVLSFENLNYNFIEISIRFLIVFIGCLLYIKGVLIWTFFFGFDRFQHIYKVGNVTCWSMNGLNIIKLINLAWKLGYKKGRPFKSCCFWCHLGLYFKPNSMDFPSKLRSLNYHKLEEFQN